MSYFTHTFLYVFFLNFICLTLPELTIIVQLVSEKFQSLERAVKFKASGIIQRIHFSMRSMDLIFFSCSLGEIFFSEWHEGQGVWYTIQVYRVFCLFQHFQSIWDQILEFWISLEFPKIQYLWFWTVNNNYSTCDRQKVLVKLLFSSENALQPNKMFKHFFLGKLFVFC
jgi:hypothetical protein